MAVLHIQYLIGNSFRKYILKQLSVAERVKMRKKNLDTKVSESLNYGSILIFSCQQLSLR